MRAADHKAFRLACAVTALALLSTPALAINNGTPTTSFEGVAQGVQVTSDWVFTVQHYALNPGDLYNNGYGARVVAARYDAPGSGTFPANDFSLLRLVPMTTAMPSMPVLGAAFPTASFPANVTIASGANSTLARAYGFTQINTSFTTYDPDGSGPSGPVTVNWLVSWDASVYVQSGDSGGALFLNHVTNSSTLLGLSSEQFTDDNNRPIGSGFVQPAAYRSWIDQTMVADLSDSQAINWVAAAPVPEPAAWLLLGAGLVGMRLAARRR